MAAAAARITAPALKVFNADAAPVKVAPELEDVVEEVEEAVVAAGATVKRVVVAVTVYVAPLLV